MRKFLVEKSTMKKIRRRQFVMAAVTGIATVWLPNMARAATKSSEWSKLSKGVSFEPLRNGTYDDLILLSSLVSVARITAEPITGVLSFYNDVAGFVGPRALSVEQGTLTAGPINVSPHMSPGPTLLIQAASAGKAAMRKAVLPGSEHALNQGDALFIPADTSFKVDNNADKDKAIYLEFGIFPVPAIIHQAGLVVEGMTAQPLTLDIGFEAADPPTPDTISIGRLTIPSGASIASHSTAGNVDVLYIESGALGLKMKKGNIQVRRAGAASPGETVKPGDEVAYFVGDAVMLPPDALGTITNASDQPLILLSVGCIEMRNAE